MVKISTLKAIRSVFMAMARKQLHLQEEFGKHLKKKELRLNLCNIGKRQINHEFE